MGCDDWVSSLEEKHLTRRSAKGASRANKRGQRRQRHGKEGAHEYLAGLGDGKGQGNENFSEFLELGFQRIRLILAIDEL